MKAEDRNTKIYLSFTKVPACDTEDTLMVDLSPAGKYTDDKVTLCGDTPNFPIESESFNVKLLFHGPKGGFLRGFETSFTAADEPPGPPEIPETSGPLGIIDPSGPPGIPDPSIWTFRNF